MLRMKTGKIWLVKNNTVKNYYIYISNVTSFEVIGTCIFITIDI